MYQKERLERIMELLEANGYLTVQYLTEQLHYSSATVNRDLQLLEQMHRLRRSYGGVEPVRPAPVSLSFRSREAIPMSHRPSMAFCIPVVESDSCTSMVTLGFTA